ncbi:MAG: metallophosphoesterase family protein [Candidatus Hydrothermarchaeota archaeon]|mgnify:CR=1 FL=1
MQVAVIADIHSNLPALEAVLEEVGHLPIYCAGDVVGYNPFPNEVIALLKERRAVSILGNHDHAVISGDTSWFNPIAAAAIEWTAGELTPGSRDYLRTLPKTYENALYMVHGSPKSPLEEYVYGDAPDYQLLDMFNSTRRDVIVLGHTHVPFIKRLGGRLVFNPGSVGQPRDGDPRASCAVLDTEELEVEIIRVAYDIDAVARAILDRGLPQPLALRLYGGW